MAGGSQAAFNGIPGSLVMAHEWGHNFGLGHSSFRDVEYGDCASCMGNCNAGMYHSGQKDRLGWVPPSRVATLHPWGDEACDTCVDGGTFTVAAHDMGPLRDGADSPSVRLALRMKEQAVPAVFNVASGAPVPGSGSDGQGWWLYFDVRSKTTSYGGLEIVRHPFTSSGCAQTSRQDVIATTSHQDALRPGSAFLYRGEKMRYSGQHVVSSTQLLVRIVNSSFPDLVTRGGKEAFRNNRCVYWRGGAAASTLSNRNTHLPTSNPVVP